MKLHAIVKGLAAGRAVPALTASLAMLELPVDKLAPLLANDRGSVAPAALAALSRTDDPRVLALIADRIPARDAIAAAGEHGDPKAIPLLRKYAPKGKLPAGTKWLRDEDAVFDWGFAVPIAIALGQLGNMSLVPLLCRLATTRDASDPMLGGNLRVAATIGLSNVAAPGVAKAIRATLDDPDPEVVAEGLRASFYLGRVSDAAAIVDVICAGGEHAGIAAWYLEQWAGERPTSKPDRWWAKAKARFKRGVCYRGGEPIDVGALAANVSSDPLHLRDQLRILTGAACFHPDLGGSTVTAPEAATIAAWSKAKAASFAPGKLHRWGRSYAPTVVD